MDLGEIMRRFSLISGLSQEKTAPLSSLCDDAKAEIQSKLKPNVIASAESRRLEAAAAALSFYKYVLYNVSMQNTQTFSAGDISIKEDSKQQLENARAIWQEAKASVCDILQDNEFCFKQVGVSL